MFGWGKKGRERAGPTPSYGIPTVKFDPARVTPTVSADLRRNVEALHDVDASQFDMIYDAALRCISAGGARDVLFNALMTIAGMSRERAGAITHSLNGKAGALMTAEHQARLGIEYATWRYSGAPCIMNPGGANQADAERDAAHKAANGMTFRIAKGMYLNGQWTLPGREDGCKCVSRSLIPDLNDFENGKPRGFVGWP